MIEQQNHIPVIAIGPTGAGKSSLLNLLIGKTLSVVNGKIQCIDEIFKVSDKGISKTKDLQKHLHFIDTPGLKDTNIFDRTLNLMKLHQFMASHSTYLMIVLASHSFEAEKGDSALQFFKFLYQFFGDLNKLKQSTILVISHFVEDYDSIEDIVLKIKDTIKQRSQEKYNYINQQESEGLQDLIDHLQKNNQIFTFNRPNNKLNTKDQCWEQHINNKDIILQYYPKLKPLDKNLLELSEKMLDKETKQVLTNEIPQEFRRRKDILDQRVIEEYFKEQIIIGDTKRSQEEKRKYLKKQVELQNNETQFNAYESYLNAIQNIDQQDQEKQEFLEFNKVIIYISKLISEDVLNNMLSIEGLNDLARDNQIRSSEASGYFIQSSFINKYFTEVSQQLTINANIFIADCDLNLSGISLLIKCEKFIITKKCTFNLSGKKGDPIQQNMTNQEDGLPGNPGYQGGIFRLIIKDSQSIRCIDQVQLVVNLSGGEGGDGQQGGDGTDGLDGKDGRLEDVKSKIKDCLVDVKEVTSTAKNMISYNREYILYYESKGESGQRGSDAKKGGIGGIKGFNGESSILDFQGNLLQTNLIEFQIDLNTNGKPGSHGKPGRGGLNGKNAKAVYQDEFIFPTLRGKQDEYNKLAKNAKLANGDKEAEGIIGNVGLGVAGSGAAILAGELAVDYGAVNLARFVTLPVSLGITGLQLFGSIISANQDPIIIEKPHLVKNNNSRAMNGYIPNDFNYSNQKQPTLLKQADKVCFKQEDICKWFCIQNNLCQYKCIQ